MKSGVVKELVERENVPGAIKKYSLNFGRTTGAGILDSMIKTTAYWRSIKEYRNPTELTAKQCF